MVHPILPAVLPATSALATVLDYACRPLGAADGPAAAVLEALCHPGALLEGAPFLGAVCEAWPGSSWGLSATGSGGLVAYCIAHPVTPGTLAALGALPCPSTPSGTTTCSGNTAPEHHGSPGTMYTAARCTTGGQPRQDWFIHDLAVHPGARGQGIPALLLRASCATARAQGCHRIRIVAVNGSTSWWMRLGFRASPPGTFDPTGLGSYGDSTGVAMAGVPAPDRAVVMDCPLTVLAEAVRAHP